MKKKLVVLCALLSTLTAECGWEENILSSEFIRESGDEFSANVGDATALINIKIAEDRILGRRKESVGFKDLILIGLGYPLFRAPFYLFGGEITPKNFLDYAKSGNLNLNDLNSYFRYYKLDTLEVVSDQGENFLHATAQGGQIEWVKFFSSRFKKDVATNSGETALHIAAKLGRGEIVKYLLEQGCNPHKRDGKGENTAQKAEKAGKASILKIIAQSQVANLKNNNDECPICFEGVDNKEFTVCDYGCLQPICVDCKSRLSECPTCRSALCEELKLKPKRAHLFFS